LQEEYLRRANNTHAIENAYEIRKIKEKHLTFSKSK
jgi:hypothetical protein